MSLIVNELGQILYRILVVCPTQRELRAHFENLALELTTHRELSAQQVELAGAALSGDRLQAWMSFNLGKRSGLNLRVSLAGFSADRELPSPHLLSFCEGLYIHAGEDDEHLERLFTMPLNEDSRRLPVLVGGIDDMPDGLRKRALEEHIRRTFSQVHALGRDQTFLSDGIEWYLIH